MLRSAGPGKSSGTPSRSHRDLIRRSRHYLRSTILLSTFSEESLVTFDQNRLPRYLPRLKSLRTKRPDPNNQTSFPVFLLPLKE